MDRQLLLNTTEFERDTMPNNIFILYYSTLKKWLHHMKRKIFNFKIIMLHSMDYVIRS